MPGACQYLMLIENKTRSLLRRLWLILTASGKVTVLLLMIAGTGVVHARDANGIDLRVFEFTSEFYMLMGRGRLHGLMASDGSQHRIAIYWTEPAVFRDSSFFLRYSDFIFSRDSVYYWIYGASQPGTFHLSDNQRDPLLPQDDSVEFVARSALAIVSRIRCQREYADIPLEVGKFFRESRGQAEHAYEVLAGEADSNDQSGGTASDVQILNALPYGREYSKYTRSDGVLVWRARRALNSQPVISVAVKPISSMQTDDPGSMFDPNTLGRWTLIPDPYRAYWSFDRAYSELSASASHRIPSREFYDKVESYLDHNKMPAHVRRALDRLRFKTALMTGDTGRVSRSAQAAVAGLCRDDSVGKYQGLLELARIAWQIQKQYPQQADDLLRPLVGQMVKHAGREAVGSIDRLMVAIDNNKWFTYGKLLLKEVRSQGLAEKGIVDTLAARLEASCLAREKLPSDPCEPTTTVKQYLAQLDAAPPAGTLTMNDVRHILEKGLAKHYTDGHSETKHKLVENVIRSIRLIVGEGPFCGNQAELIKSIERFSWLYLVVDKTREPIDTVLATFLALSFCDISTPEDHDVLFSQIHKLSTELQTHLNTMLSERGLSALVTPSDVEGVLRGYERLFRRYIDDPLWPAFKFPLTANEQIRFTNKIKLHFMRLELEPLFEEMSLKLKYAGSSAELKKMTLHRISLAVEPLLSEIAFLRRPPGVLCRFQGRYGFTVVIKGPLYKDVNRPKERFKAMKYFHLGHRLEHIVKKERELARPR